MTYYFNINTKATTQEKIDCVYNVKDSNNCKSYTTSEVLSLIDQVINEETKIYFHEFILDTYPECIKLFIDIDINSKSMLDNNLFSFNEEEVLLELINEILDELKNEFVFSKTKDLTENIAITKNNNPNKISYHIIFNNIIYNTNIQHSIKIFFQNLINNTNNILIKAIDTAVYRKSTQLRFIYSSKQDSDTYHEPYLIFNNGTTREINIQNDLNLFSIITNNDETLRLKEQINTIHDSILNLDVNTPYYIKYLSGMFLSRVVFNKKGIQMPNEINEINDKIGFKVSEELEFTLNHCSACNKTHKNKFKIIFDKDFIIVTKNGNPNSCKKLPMKCLYPSISAYDLSRYLVENDLIRRQDKNNYLIWKNYKWTLINTNVELINFIINDANIYRQIDKIMITNLKTNILDHYVSIQLGSKIMELTFDPYLVKFNNGILNLKTNEFTHNSEETKNILKLYGIDMDYVKEDDLKNDSEYISNKELLDDLFHKIIFVHNDKINSDIFRANLSTVLYSGHKPVVTYLIGETSGGKSTIKALIENLMKDSYCDLPIESYTQKMKANVPNPWIGSINYKMVSFASEKDQMDTFKVINLKHMTEKRINARMLKSNDKTQVNHLTQFIDLNFNPTFDFNDAATYKRYSIVRFNSYFPNPNDVEKEIKAEGRLMFDRNDKLDYIINNGDFRMPLLHTLINWFRMYHVENLSMISADIMEEKGITGNDKFFKDFLNNETIIIRGKELNIIKSDIRHYYKIVKLQQSTFIVCSKQYFINKLKKIYIDKHTDDLINDLTNYLYTSITRDICSRCIKEDVELDLNSL